MTLQKINLGTTVGDKTGDGARIAGAKINANFDYLEGKIENRNKVIVNAGLTQDSNEILLNAGWQWIINGVVYSNPVPVIIDIPVAAAGLSRVDNIVATTSNTFSRLPGTESETPVAPIFVEGTIVVAFAIINDTALQNSANVDPEKLDRAGYNGTAITLYQQITSIDEDLNTRIDDVAYEIQEVQLPLKANQLTTYTKSEVDVKINNYFKGIFLTEAALIAALPTASIGDYAQVNETGATDVVNYNWDAEENTWVKNAVAGSGALNTDQLPEGTSNLYFTVARFLANLTFANVVAALGFTPSTAPNNAQKNSDITKSEIESKLTGEITSHTHPITAVGNSKNTSSRVDLSLVSSSNALLPLITPTSDGSGEAVHPSVLYFKEAWNNYHYWMVITPYNNSNSELENPEILVSNNGIDWIVPPGVTNPLVPSPANGYSADTELVYDNDNDFLWIIWRATISGIDYVKVISSSDGVIWTNPVDILTSSTFYYASPAVIYEKGIFTLWWVEVTFGDAVPRVLKYKTSTNMLSGWSSTTSCNVVFPSGKDIWHLSMRKVNEEYHAFMHVGTARTDSAIGHELYFATSLDNLTYKLTSSPVIRQGQENNFDKDSIYRGSAIYFPNSNKYTFFYSGNTLTGGIRKWRISYTDIFLDKVKLTNFETISTSQKIHAIHNDKILKIKSNVTLTVPFEKLQDDFVCYFDVFPGFALTLVFESGNSVTGNTSLVLSENKMAILYKDATTNNFRLKGDI